MNHVDYNMFGGLALKLFRITGDERYRTLGMEYADTQWEVPSNAKPGEKEWADKGYSWQTRMWIDDMYMITVVQTEAFKVTGEAKYLDRAAEEMVLYLETIQRPNGLFYHAPDVPYYWARGDGWMAVGMADLLKILPEGHKNRERIMKGYLTMMESLLGFQDADGMWHQLIDRADAWPESSGSAMFTYAFIVGVRQGWLDAAKYAPAARRAWLTLVTYIDSRNNVTEVCIGTGKQNSLQYYYDRPRVAGDLHGQAPYLWCAAALLQ
jgi:rhamnogalacturonyl hydrolase YesR